MRRTLVLLALFVVAGAPRPAVADDLAFQYTIQRERDGSVVDDTFLRGFEVTDGLRLRVKLNQTSYCYLIVSAPAGGYRLAFPNPGTLKAALPLNEWARIPRSTFLRMGEDPGIKRMYIIVSTRRVSELDDAAAKGGEVVLSEASTLELKSRYAHAEAGYTKQLEGQTFSIKYRGKAGEPSSVVEEITLPGDGSKRSDSK